MTKSQIWYLNKYYKLQPKIMLVSRRTSKDVWSKRALYLSKEYNPHMHYNHRSILQNEIVIEYDFDDIQLNKTLAYNVTKRLKKYDIDCGRWTSSNKSTHIHIFIDYKDCQDIVTLKRVFMRYFGTYYRDEKGKIYYEKSNIPKGQKVERLFPDMKLAASNHLIRAEYGIHEVTSMYKKPISAKSDYIQLHTIPQIVWEKYQQQKINNTKIKISRNTQDIENHEAFKFIVAPEAFRSCEDGRERCLFLLIHILKDKYTHRKKDLIRFLKDWYKYSGGTKLEPFDIERKVNYHWERNYNVGVRHVLELLEDLGQKTNSLDC